jgi:TatD DNase family protein
MELRLFSRLLDRTTYVGEVGLDFSAQGKPTRRRQVEVFERLLSEPSIPTKVLSVHTRGAEAETITRLAQVHAQAILHWYSGPLKYVDEALAAGMYFSVNPAMLRGRNGQRIIDALPTERLLTETDGPYTKVRGRAAEPSDIPWLVAQIAKRRGMTQLDLRSQIANNLRALASV